MAEAVKAALTTLRQRGFNRLYQPAYALPFDSAQDKRASAGERGPNGAAGRLFEFSTPESLLDLDFSQPVYVLVDRLAVPATGEDASAFRSRLVDSVELSCREGNGEVFIELAETASAESWLRFTERFECRRCGSVYAPPEPSLFSFNSPYGACPRCHGFGNTIDFDLDKVIPDKTRPLSDGAIDPWSKPRYRHLLGELRRFCRREGIDPDASWSELSARERRKILEATPTRRGQRLLRLAGAKEIQAARARFSAATAATRSARVRGRAPGKEARAVRLPMQAGEESGAHCLKWWR
jgi:excinuclease ABC subunit A